MQDTSYPYGVQKTYDPRQVIKYQLLSSAIQRAEIDAHIFKVDYSVVNLETGEVLYKVRAK